jgi:hypothetical protein
MSEEKLFIDLKVATEIKQYANSEELDNSKSQT